MAKESRQHWCVLIHALPARPLYLRARVRRQLAQVGAAPLKKAVYVLPYSDQSLERLRSIGAEIAAAGASAFVCEATFSDAKTDRIVVLAYNQELHVQYRAWMDEARSMRIRRPARAAGAAQQSRTRAKARSAADVLPERLARLHERLEALRARDLFRAPGNGEAAALLADLEHRHAGSSSAGRGKADLVGLRWVTRKGLHVDRLACAWVVRRFVDPSATFRFVALSDPALAAGEIGFDMPGAAITHEGGRCSVESLVLRAGVKDPAVQRIAEIVHDIDLKDERYRHPETSGFEQLLVGTIVSHPRDEDRLEHGLALFDALYAAASRGAPRLSATLIPAGPVRVPPQLRKGRRS